MGKICFFIGHRDTPDIIFPRLCQAVTQHIVQYGVDTFYIGHYGRFDSLAAQAVLLAKMKYTNISVYLLLPYHPFERPVQVPQGFDGTFYPTGMEDVPKRYAIPHANLRMVDMCNYLIAYVQYPSNGSKKVLNAALHKQAKGEIHVCNLGDYGRSAC